MRLIKLLILLLAVHMGCGFTQMAAAYYGGDTAVSSNLLEHTPIGSFIDVDNLDAMQRGAEADPSQIRQMVGFINQVGDMSFGLVSFEYGFLTDMQPSDGVVYNIVVLFRLASVILWLSLGMTIIYILFDSGLLTSPLGLAAVAGITVLTSLVGLGAAN